MSGEGEAVKRVRQMTGEDGKDKESEAKVRQGCGSVQKASVLLPLVLRQNASVGRSGPAMEELVDTRDSVYSHDLSVRSRHIPRTHSPFPPGEGSWQNVGRRELMVHCLL